MDTKFIVEPQGLICKVADMLMIPCMYALSGTLRESPQRTHFWNNTKLGEDALSTLEPSLMVRCTGIDNEVEPSVNMFPIFHMPIFGGWRNYVVLEPRKELEAWYVGWVTSPVSGGVSRIQVNGRVRMLISPGDVQFFCINANTSQQEKILESGKGVIGSGGRYRKVPLL